MPMTDPIGDRGEAIFRYQIMNYEPGGGPLFSPCSLGEKFATLDFLVELLGLPAGRVAYFFVQVKATRRGFTKKPPTRLNVNVSQEDIDRMLIYPGPTYVVGINETPGHEQAFLAAVNEPGMGRIQGLPTIHPMNLANLRTLWREVDDYWRNNAAPFNNSAFAI